MGLGLRKSGAFDTAATIAMLLATGAISWHTLPARSVAKHPKAIKLEADRVAFGGPESVGLSSAPIGIIEFADLQCPYCADFARLVFPRIKAEYIDRGIVRFDFRNFPLPIHPLAHAEAVAGYCLTKLGNFSSAHDYLFGRTPDTTKDRFASAVTALSLAPQAFEACSQDPASAALIDGDIQLAHSLGVTATPTFVVGRLVGTELQVTAAVSGTGEFVDFEKLIDEAIASHGQ